MPTPEMTPARFVEKWKAVELSERAASQEHFLDLCRLPGQPTYNERPTWLRIAHEKLDRAVLAAYAPVDPQGNWAKGWAEVWTETSADQSLPENHPLRPSGRRSTRRFWPTC